MRTPRVPFKGWMNRLHEIGFGTGIGERTESLLHGISWTVPVAMVSRVICGISTMFAARWMGPEEYGKANLALAITLWIQIPLFFGLPTALLHFAPQAKTKEKDEWIREGLILQSAAGLLTLVSAFTFRAVWARYERVPVDVFNVAVIWCGSFFLYMMATTLFTAQEKFRARALSDLGFALLFPAAILLSRVLQALNGTSYVLALSFGYAGIGIAALLSARVPQSLVRGPMERWRPLLWFGVTASLGGVVNALFNSPARMVVNRTLGLHEVGLLSAYQAGSIQMAFFVLAAFVQVFFPIASRTPDKRRLLRKLNRLLLFGSMLSIPAFAALLKLYFTVLGRGFTPEMREMFIFSLAACMTLCYGVLAWFLSSQGVRGTFSSSIIGIVAGIINYAACVHWIPQMKLLGAGLAHVAASAVALAGCYLYMLGPDGWRDEHRNRMSKSEA